MEESPAMVRVLATATLAMVLTALGFGPALADGSCSSVRTQVALRSVFVDAGSVFVCGAPGANRPTLEWNETHVGGGSGVVYEKGLAVSGRGDEVGTYQVEGASAAADGILHHDYGEGGLFNWTVDARPDGTTDQFCTADTPRAPAFKAVIKPSVCGADC